MLVKIRAFLPQCVSARFAFILWFCGLVFLGACRQSEFLRKRYVDFNFSDEGFLSPSLLQTIAYASYQSARRGSRNDERLCLELAQREARKRLLRVILHLYFDISSKDRFDRQRGEAPMIGRAEHSFDRDYPAFFSNDDLLRAELAFSPFLQRAFVALQDSRNPGQCMVVCRMQVKNLAQEIRKAKINFKLRSTARSP